MKPNRPPVTPLRARVAVFAVELMLEPGMTVTHAAVKLCAENRTLILWTGEAGRRVYSDPSRRRREDPATGDARKSTGQPSEPGAAGQGSGPSVNGLRALALRHRGDRRS